MHRLLFPIPIVQAPMAGISTPALAAAVSNAGGLGSLGVGACTPEQAKRMIDETRALTTGPINVNVFCHAPPVRDGEREAAWLNYLAPFFAEFDATVPTALREIYKSFLVDDEMLRVLLDAQIAYVSFHFGLPPASVIQSLRNAGICTMATATSVFEANAIEAAGVDAIVAQGIEAGGHRGVFFLDAPDDQLATLELVRLLASETKLPIIAAGGIMDGSDIHAAIQAGAIAAQLGTAFLLCPEAGTNDCYRQKLKNARAVDTRVTSAISGRPGRAIDNRLVLAGDVPMSPTPATYPLAYDVAKQLGSVAAERGNCEFGAYWAGQGVSRLREIPATQLMKLLAGEFESTGHH